MASVPLRDYVTDFTACKDTICKDLALTGDFVSLEQATDTWVAGNRGLIQCNDGPMVLLWGVDTTTLNASWFDFAFV